MSSKEDTLWYYREKYSPKYNPDLAPIEKQKAARKFLKSCERVDDWATYAYEHNLEFNACQIFGDEVNAYLSVDATKDLLVGFLDEYFREYMLYAFRQQDNGQYFLYGMRFFEFINGKTGSKDFTIHWSYTFKPTGEMTIRERNVVKKTNTLYESKRPLNVASNWEPRPEFGEWDGFFKLKRWAAGELDEPFQGLPENRWLPWE